MVSVPKGGVFMGQRFSVPFVANSSKEDDIILPSDKATIIPEGQWRDNWYDLFRLGFDHPTVWNSCCCLPST